MSLRILTTAAFLFVLDQFWFNASLNSVYLPAVAAVTGTAEAPVFDVPAAAAAWLALAALITYMKERCPEISATLLGFLTYAVCNFTIKALFPDYHWSAVIADIAWGTLLVTFVFNTTPLATW
jgi:uncharacterized membrane protein